MKTPITTPLLDTHPRIGPFFFKEGIVIIVALATLWYVMLWVKLFFDVKLIYVLAIPVLFLLGAAILRFFLIKKITSPWYMNHWLNRRFIWPRSIRGGWLD